MIGLKRHTVRLVEHRPEWVALFQAESALLQEAIADLVLDIQHVGSTAVLDLPAKPILDIAVAVRSRDDIPVLVTRLVRCGYIDRGDAGRDGGYLLVKERAIGMRTVYVHVVEHSDSQWRDYLAFRDVLRRDRHVRERYAALKRDLARRFATDRRSYTAGKNAFIQEVLAGCSGPPQDRSLGP